LELFTDYDGHHRLGLVSCGKKIFSPAEKPFLSQIVSILNSGRFREQQVSSAARALHDILSVAGTSRLGVRENEDRPGGRLGMRGLAIASPRRFPRYLLAK
jgi:hypothetical protein